MIIGDKKLGGELLWQTLYICTAIANTEVPPLKIGNELRCILEHPQAQYLEGKMPSEKSTTLLSRSRWAYRRIKGKNSGRAG
jgi:hypothetical protein